MNSWKRDGGYQSADQVIGMRSVSDGNLSVSRVEAELEGESEQRPFVTSRLEICLKQTLRRHHMVTDGILILFHMK